jgi:hypothetical protein
MGIAAYNRGTKVLLERLHAADDEAREIEGLLQAVVRAEELESECRNIRGRIADSLQRKGLKGAYVPRTVKSRGYQSRMRKVIDSENAWRDSPGPERRPMRHCFLVTRMHAALRHLENWLEKELRT